MYSFYEAKFRGKGRREREVKKKREGKAEE
jgi:hypothetical protein